MGIFGIDHVQLAMPPRREEEARAFYAGVLGFTEVEKPENLKKRGGCWFEAGNARVHLGVEAEFRAAHRAHPALLVSGLAAFVVNLGAAGIKVRLDEPLDGYERVYVSDPFGNRIELRSYANARPCGRGSSGRGDRRRGATWR